MLGLRAAAVRPHKWRGRFAWLCWNARPRRRNRSPRARPILRLLEKTSGDVFFDGQDVYSWSKEELRRMDSLIMRCAGILEEVLGTGEYRDVEGMGCMTLNLC